MLIKSHYPAPPAPPDLNAYHVFFNRPDQQQSPWTDKDFTLYINLETGKSISYRSFIAQVARTRAALTQAGFKEGELVGVISENCLDYPILIHAFLSLNIPFALIAPYSTPLELAHAIKLTEIKKVFAGPHQVGMSWPEDVHLYVMNGSAKGYVSLEDLLESSASAPAVGVRTAKETDLAYLVFSSGTSGLPKAVMITHGNLIYSIYQITIIGKATAAVAPPQRPLDTPEGIPVNLAFLPLHHSYGLHCYCFRAFLLPTTCVFQPRWNLEDALRGIAKYKVSNMNMIPSVIAQVVAHPSPNLIKTALKTLTYVSSGAAYLPPELTRRLVQLLSAEVRVSEGYGMSEVTLAATTHPFPGSLGKLRVVEGSCGVLLPGMEAKILDDEGNSVKVGETGELWLRGYNIVVGYYGSGPDVFKANRDTFVDGWLRTGDKFYVDDEGNFFFADRMKDTLKISGEQVSPLEIENVLLAHPEKWISDVAVAGVSGGRTRDERIPRAWIVLSERGQKLVQTLGQKDAATQRVVRELLKWCEGQLSKFKWLRGGIEIVDEIPKNPTGKTLRRILVERYEKTVQPSAKL